MDVRRRYEAGALVEGLGEPLEATVLVCQREIGDRHLLKVDRPSSLGETVQDPEGIVAPPEPCVRLGDIRRLAESGAVEHGQRLLRSPQRFVGRP